MLESLQESLHTRLLSLLSCGKMLYEGHMAYTCKCHDSLKIIVGLSTSPVSPTSSLFHSSQCSVLERAEASNMVDSAFTHF